MTSVEEVLAVTAECPRREFPSGTVLLEEGRRAGILYFLESGTVEILKQGQPISSVSQPGAVFGEVSVLLEQVHMATVRAATDLVCRVVENPREFLASHPAVSLHVASLLARRLSAVTTYLVDLKRQYEDREDHLGMVDEVLESLLQLQVKRRRN
ncbi:MAG: Crp/Fnr family transcriptional regulator [Limisphaerales bacterium]